MIRSLPCCANSGQYCAHAFLVVEPPARVRDGQRHRGQALGGRVDDHHGVLLPRLASLLVPDAAPQVDDFLAGTIGAAGAAQFAPPSEVLGEGLAHASKPRLTCPCTEFDTAAVMVPLPSPAGGYVGRGKRRASDRCAPCGETVLSNLIEVENSAAPRKVSRVSRPAQAHPWESPTACLAWRRWSFESPTRRPSRAATPPGRSGHRHRSRLAQAGPWESPTAALHGAVGASNHPPDARRGPPHRQVGLAVTIEVARTGLRGRAPLCALHGAVGASNHPPDARRGPPHRHVGPAITIEVARHRQVRGRAPLRALYGARLSFESPTRRPSRAATPPCRSCHHHRSRPAQAGPWESPTACLVWPRLSSESPTRRPSRVAKSQGRAFHRHRSPPSPVHPWGRPIACLARRRSSFESPTRHPSRAAKSQCRPCHRRQSLSSAVSR